MYHAQVLVYTTLIRSRGVLFGRGYWLITPLQLENAAIIMVNRGFVPLNHKPSDLVTSDYKPGLPYSGQQVDITGLLVLPELITRFTPKNRSYKSQWFTNNPSAIAKKFNLNGKIAGFIIDADATSSMSIPQGGETILRFHNNHLGYALTWFGLAFVVLISLLIWVTKRYRISKPFLFIKVALD